MLKALKNAILENIDSIATCIAMMNGGDYRPIVL